MRRLRRHLTYANVMATISAFAVLAGGSAIAASQLGKNSVGKKQLRANAVTTAKIKKNAVTKRKIRNGAVNGAKVKDGSLGVGSLNLADMPFSRIVHKARGPAATALTAATTLLPLENPTYTQAAGEDDFFYGSLEVTLQPGCEPPREVSAVLTVDAPNPLEPDPSTVVGTGRVEDEAGGTVTKLLRMGSVAELGASSAALFQPDTATNRTLAVGVRVSCKSGAGATASNAMIDVVGVR